MYKQTRFHPFVALVVISSVKLAVKSSQIFKARDHWIQQDSNFQSKKECSFRQFIGFCESAVDFSLWEKNWSVRFPWETSSNLRKTFISSLPNCSEFYRRKRQKIHCQHVMFFIELADRFWFRPQRTCDPKTFKEMYEFCRWICKPWSVTQNNSCLEPFPRDSIDKDPSGHDG